MGKRNKKVKLASPESAKDPIQTGAPGVTFKEVDLGIDLNKPYS